MFRKIAIFSLIIPWLLFSGCASRPADERPTIFVSILPLRGIVSEIVGDDFRVEVLVPPGMNPESFEPTPRQMIDLNRSQLIFNIGWIDFEQNMLSKIEDRRKVIDLHRGIEPIAGSCSHADAEKEHRHGVDPHIWTSPRELRTMADNAYRAIHELYPDSTVYAVNYQCLADKLQALDDSVAERLKQSGVPYFMIYHPALTYYARAYGIEQVAIEQDGKEPSAKRAGPAYRAGSPGQYSCRILPEPVPGFHRRSDRRRYRGAERPDRSAGRRCRRQYFLYYGSHNCRTSMKTPLVSLRRVSVSYDGHDALKEVDLDIYPDDFLGIIGPNGGGKTTLVKAIVGTIPYRGTISYSPQLFRGKERLIGYMPQQSIFDRSFPISVLEVVMSGLQGQRGFHARYASGDRAKAQELLRTAGIDGIARKPIGEISGGQMQRALLCRAVISDPKLLILDEPANFVDNRFENELYRMLAELHGRMAIVMISHDLGTITSVVRNIVCVNRYVHRHDSNIITEEQLRNYDCPIQLISHGKVPHTVLALHPHDCCPHTRTEE